jgi:hypothetical protein
MVPYEEIKSQIPVLGLIKFYEASLFEVELNGRTAFYELASEGKISEHIL